MASKSAKMGHSKFDKFKQDVQKKEHYCYGGVCSGYNVHAPDGEILATYEMMWDAIDHKLRLNTR